MRIIEKVYSKFVCSSSYDGNGESKLHTFIFIFSHVGFEARILPVFGGGG